MVLWKKPILFLVKKNDLNGIPAQLKVWTNIFNAGIPFVGCMIGVGMFIDWFPNEAH